jgi:hypothetical protein
MHGSSFPFIPELFSVTSMAEKRADAPSPKFAGAGGRKPAVRWRRRGVVVP